MTDWFIVALDWIIIMECVAIALWYGSDLSKSPMRWLFIAFLLLAVVFLIFPIPRDFMFAMQHQIDGFWFLDRPYTILPWRMGMALSFGITICVLRFSDWGRTAKIKDGR